MTCLGAHLYGNPETILMRKQEYQAKKEKSCTGCVNRRVILFGEEKVQACTVMQAARMRKCEFYKAEKE